MKSQSDINENEMGGAPVATTLNTPGMGNVITPEPIVDDEDEDEEVIAMRRKQANTLKNLKTFEEYSYINERLKLDNK